MTVSKYETGSFNFKTIQAFLCFKIHLKYNSNAKFKGQ